MASASRPVVTTDSWNSSDQIAENAVPLVGFFGTLNPTDGGHSQRYSLQGEWHRQGASSFTKIRPMDFTTTSISFPTSPTSLSIRSAVTSSSSTTGDGSPAWTRTTPYSARWFGRKMENTLGLQVRNDWIHNGLFQSQARVRVDKTDSSSGSTLPATTQADRSPTRSSASMRKTVQWAEKLRSILACVKTRNSST